MVTKLIPQAAEKRKLLIALHAGFLLIGIITVLLGQILPILAARLILNDTQAGYLFIAQFSGSLLGTIFYNQFIKIFGGKKTLLGSFCLMAGGCAGLNLDGWILTLLSIFTYGIGIGIAIPVVNLLAVELNREKSSAALNIINFFWGLGAILCKPFVDFAGSPNNIALPTALLSILLLFCGLTIISSKHLIHSAKIEKVALNAVSIWTTKTAWLFAIFNFIQIGIESSAGGWITTFEMRLTGNAAVYWFSAAPAFFFFVVFGRGTAPFITRLIGENAVLLCSLILMSTGSILILRADDFLFLMFGTVILGFGCSSVFPINMSRFTKKFGDQSTKNAAPMFILGNLGGAFTTWMVGLTATIFSNLRAGFSIILVGCFSLIILHLILAKSPQIRKTN